MCAINITQHSIDLIPGARPVNSAAYRAGPNTRELEQFEIEKNLKDGVIELSNSEWAAPVLLVPMKDGRLLFCIDYRKLNLMTIKYSYTIPRMDECIDSPGNASVFTTLVAYSGYWQVSIKPEDRHKSASVYHSVQFQYVRMPFGKTKEQ